MSGIVSGAAQASQEEFAHRVGVHRTYIERGERNLSLLNIGRIATALHVPLSALMAEVEKLTPYR